MFERVHEVPRLPKYAVDQLKVKVLDAGTEHRVAHYEHFVTASFWSNLELHNKVYI